MYIYIRYIFITHLCGLLKTRLEYVAQRRLMPCDLFHRDSNKTLTNSWSFDI